MPSSTQSSITNVEPKLEWLSTNDSADLDAIEEDPDHPIHRQDWSVTTKPTESWAVKERRRSSIFNKAPIVKPAPSPTDGDRRKGSVLSLWSAGKDKLGNHILKHHDDDSKDKLDSESAIESPKDDEFTKSPSEEPTYQPERRGSILSLWKGGKDANGRPIMKHNDEEWVERERKSSELGRSPPKPAPITSWIG